MKSWKPATLALAALAGACAIAPDEPSAEARGDVADPEGPLTVMTRNLDLGADLAPIFAASDVAAFNRAAVTALDRIAASRFPERAQALALEIAIRRPDVIGLQEVFDLALDGSHGAPPYRDHLADLLRALARFGQHYVVVAQTQELATTIPLDLDRDGIADAGVDVRDRDVVLVRQGVPAAPVAFSAFCARPALDGGPGCNYQAIATVPTVTGALAIQRGFAGVDLVVHHRAYRVVTTQLDAPDADPTKPRGGALPAAQAQELIAVLAATTPASHDLIVIGDLRGAAEQGVQAARGVTIVPPAVQLAAAGFHDACSADLGRRPCSPGALPRGEVIVTRRRPVSAAVEQLAAPPHGHAGLVARLRF